MVLVNKVLFLLLWVSSVVAHGGIIDLFIPWQLWRFERKGSPEGMALFGGVSLLV